MFLVPAIKKTKGISLYMYHLKSDYETAWRLISMKLYSLLNDIKICNTAFLLLFTSSFSSQTWTIAFNIPFFFFVRTHEKI